MLFEHWGEFYLLAGSAAAVLIGLIFVVVTLMQDWSRSRVINGSKLYMGPIVLRVSFVLVLSAAALSPHISAHQYAIIAAIVGFWGLARGFRSILGIRALAASDDPPHWSDLWCYGIVPSMIDFGLLIVALGFWRGEAWAEYGVAAVITALLLISIRNEWDLVVWLAPHPDRGEKR